MRANLPSRLRGVTAPFNGNGRDLGYPTANLAVATNLKDGVYFGFADMAAFKKRPALIFVGTPLTLGDRERRVEAHLLDIPNQDYYGQKLALTICHHHRANQKFHSLDELKKAMRVDEAIGRAWFDKNSLATKSRPKHT
jgi:FAD synthase